MKDEKIFVTVQALSQRLGISAAWIRAEAKAGRIPTLKTHRRMLFNAPLVERLLLERANQTQVNEQGDAR